MTNTAPKPKYHHFPYANIHHPTKYADLMRGVRGGKTPAALRWFSIFLVGMIVAMCVMAITAIYAWGRVYNPAFTLLQLVLMILAAVGLLMFIVVDIAGVVFAADALHSDRATGRLDLIRVSMMRPDAYIARHLALVRVRVWRVLMVMMGLRLGLVAGLLTIGAAALLEELVATGFRDAYIDTFAIVFLLINGFLLGMMWFYEPFWRFRAMTALVVSIGARHPQNTMLRIGLALGARWLVIAVITGMLGGISFFISVMMIVMGPIFNIAFLSIIPAIRLYLLNMARHHEEEAAMMIFETAVD